MKYEELYEAWKREMNSTGPAELSPDFYSRLASYIRKIKEENRMLDKRTAKASLLKRESENSKRLIRELVRVRYGKLVRGLAKREKPPANVLTVEEERIYSGALPFAESFRGITNDVLHGLAPRIQDKTRHKRVALRFIADVPAIIGADMKPYGPFKTEDVASLPNDNAKILVKQGLAELVDSS
jgi:DNA replication factor GINS